MKKHFSLSFEEDVALAQLGGVRHCHEVANRALAEHGFHRGLFSATEVSCVEGTCSCRQPRTQVEFHFDSGKSLRANIADLLGQAQEVQTNAGGTNYVGAMLQHLVGAKLDVVLGLGTINHHGFSVADQATERKGDFQIESVAIHVTTHPNEALIRKCADNLQAGLKPLIVTIGDGVAGAAFLLKGSPLADRVDVLDVSQFLTANVYERSFFKAAACKVTLAKLLERYNEIVATCETDPTLHIKLGEPSTPRPV